MDGHAQEGDGDWFQVLKSKDHSGGHKKYKYR